MKVHVSDLLMCERAIVLQNVVILDVLRRFQGGSDLFGDGEELGEVFVGDVGEFLAVVFGDDELVLRKQNRGGVVSCGCVGRPSR